MASVAFLSLIVIIFIAVNSIFLSLNFIFLCYYTHKPNTSECHYKKSKTNILTLPGDFGYIKEKRLPFDYDENQYMMFVAGVVKKINKKEYLVCESSIISEYWVVTVTSCINLIKQEFNVNEKDVYITAGAINWKLGNIHRIRKFVYYNENEDDHLALIRVKNPFVLESEYQIPLYRSLCDKKDIEIEIYGWSYYRSLNPHSLFHKIMTNKECYQTVLRIMSNTSLSNISENQICTDVCQFNIGSPIVSDGYLIGISQHYNLDCAHKAIPGIYVRVSNYADWIDAAIKN